MKTILSLTLSLSLIVSPVAFAGEAKTKGYADQILGIANGLAGATIITSCPMATLVPSMMAYMAGSTVYIAAEILGGELLSGKKKKSDKKLAEIQANMQQGGDFQKAAIDAQIEDEEQTLELIKKRRKWILAVKVSYAAATGLAIYEAFQPLEEVKKPGCKAGQGTLATEGLRKGIATAYAAASGFAGGGMMGAAAAGGVTGAALYTDLFKEMELASQALDKGITVLNDARYRVAFFGAAGALSLLIDSNLASEEEKSKKKISDLERARAQFYQNTSSTTQLAEGSLAKDINLATSNAAVKALPTGSTATKSCYSRQNGVTTYSAEGCASPLSISRTAFSANMDLPSLSTAANTATDMANAIASGNTAGADVAAGNLAGMAARIDAVNKTLMKQVNDKLVAKGEKPLDTNPTAAQNAAAAAIGGGQGPSSSGAAQMAAVSPTPTSVEKSESNLSTLNIQNISTPSGKMEPVQLSEAGIGGLTETEMLATQAKAEKQLNELEIVNNNDISKSKEVSIFKQVSNRYILNYNKIFERKELPSEVPSSPAQ